MLWAASLLCHGACAAAAKAGRSVRELKDFLPIRPLCTAKASVQTFANECPQPTVVYIDRELLGTMSADMRAAAGLGAVDLRFLDERPARRRAPRTAEPVEKRANRKPAKRISDGPVWNPVLSADDMTRYTRMALWSAASYCSEDSLLAWDCGPRCSGLTANTDVALYFQSSITDTVGFIGTYADMEAEEDVIVVAFRGSVTFTNWVENMKFIKEPSPWPDSDYPSARVHSGFLDSYADIASTIRAVVMILKRRFPDGRIVVTGHSLGGAVATLCAADLKYHLGQLSPIEMVTFQSPRVGNDQFAGFINAIFDSTIDPAVGNYTVRRFTNKADPMVHLPPAFLSFMHVSQEVWVNLDNATQACDPQVGEDPNCADSVTFPDDLDDHFYIWNVQFGTDCSV